MSASHDPKRASSSISAAELQKMTLPEPRWIVPGLISEGFTLLAGKPKVGKSWLALDLAIAVATCGEVLGIKCPQAPVVYAALEDNQGRLQGRMDALLGDMPWPDQLHFVRELPPMNHGSSQLRALCLKRTGANLLIVDMLAKDTAHEEARREPLRV